MKIEPVNLKIVLLSYITFLKIALRWLEKIDAGGFKFRLVCALLHRASTLHE